MFRSLRSANILLAFLLELAMLAAFAAAGWMVPGTLWVRIGMLVLFPAIAVVLWGLWAAPRAGARRLKNPALWLFKAAMFGAAVGALWYAEHPFLAAIFGSLAVINLLTAAAFRQV